MSIDIVQDGGIAIVRFARPEKLNALTLAMYDDLGSGLIGHNQKMTVAARAMAEKKTVGHRS